MGLAEPRKRLKISHDPNNLAWSQSADSYGQKLLSSQGWKPGQGLGARNAKHLNSPSVPKLAISFKDDTLGLGASLKSQDPIHARTGLDAFQGLLGRLNGKSDTELKKEVQKNEDKKLAMWAQGRWGGVMFVPGGTLVQGDGYKRAEENSQQDIEAQGASGPRTRKAKLTDKSQRKAEKKRRREERRRKSETKSDDKLASPESESPERGVKNTKPADELLGESPRGQKTRSVEKKKRERPILSVDENGRAPAAEGKKASSIISPAEDPSESRLVDSPKTALLRTGRHVIRGRNIEAKKMAFSDIKVLDQIFMARS